MIGIFLVVACCVAGFAILKALGEWWS